MPPDGEFARTAARLAGEGRGALVLGGGVVLLGLWAIWLSCAPIAVHLETDRARIEVRGLVHPVHAAVGGQVTASTLALDRRVHQGEVLVELDRADAELELQGAEARLAANREVLQRMEGLVHAQRAVADQLAVAGRAAVDETATRAEGAAITARFAATNAEELADLSRRGIAAAVDALKSQAEADGNRSFARAEAFASKRVAADQVSLVMDRQVEVGQLQVEMSRLQVAIATDEVAVRRLRLDVDHRTVRSPIEGRLGWIAALAGGQQVSEGQPLATVVPDGPVHVVAEFPARESLGRLRAGQPAVLTLEAFPWTRYGPIVGWISHVGTEPVDGAVQVEVDIDEARSEAPARDHGLEGTLSVTVDRATPLSLLMRSIGRVGEP